MFKIESLSVKNERLKWLQSKCSNVKSHGKTLYNNYSDEECSNKKSRMWIKRSKYRRMQKQKKRQKVSVFFNYSKVKLTPAMEKVLNRGSIFAILPLKLNMTQVLVE